MISIWSEHKAKWQMRGPIARMMHLNVFSIVTTRIISFTAAPTWATTRWRTSTLRMTLEPVRVREFQLSILRRWTTSSSSSSARRKWALTTNQSTTQSCHHQHPRRLHHRRRQSQAQITISTRTILHMHTQIRTNLANFYEALYRSLPRLIRLKKTSVLYLWTDYYTRKKNLNAFLYKVLIVLLQTQPPPCCK